MLEDLSFEDQLNALGSARSIIAPHGAGLTLCSMIAQAKIIELEFIDRRNPCFKSIVNGRTSYTTISAFKRSDKGGYITISNVFEEIKSSLGEFSTLNE